MNRAEYFSWLCLVILSAFCISITRGQNSDFKILADPYQLENGVFKQWDNDMVRIGITTKERGLIFKITVSNPQETDFVTIEKLRIDVTVKYGDEFSSTFMKQVTTSYIYLPPRENHEIFIPVEFRHSDVVGSYKAELTYVEANYVEKEIEPYPFEFRIVSEDQFAKEKEQKQTGPIINIGPFEITIFDLGGITVVIISIPLVVYVLRRRRRE